MDILIKNAVLANGEVTDITIQNGQVIAIAPNLDVDATTLIDAQNKLVLPAFVNGQLHACKVFWRRKLAALPKSIQALPRFEAAQHVKATYTFEDVVSRVDEVMRLSIAYGTCAIRLFADVDEANGLTAFKGLLEIKKRYQHLMEVQVVAFPQDGVLGKHTQDLMLEALSLGADVVGGIPWIEQGDDAKKAHTQMCFDLAERSQKPLHLVADDTLDSNSKTLEDIAKQTLKRNLHGNVCATQCASLSFQEDDYAAHVIGLLKEAEITVFSNSHVSLVTSEQDRNPYPRGTTRVKDLLKAGVALACAQDDIDNWYYPFGRNSMLEVAQFMAHVGGFGWESEQVLPMVTSTPAQALRVKNYGLFEGAEANIILLDASDWRSALQFQVPPSQVILRGKVVAQNRLERSLYLS